MYIIGLNEKVGWLAAACVSPISPSFKLVSKEKKNYSLSADEKRQIVSARLPGCCDPFHIGTHLYA